MPKAVLLRKSQCHQKARVIGSVSHKAALCECQHDDDETMINVLRCQLTY